MYLSDRQFLALAAASLLAGAVVVASPLVPAAYRFRPSSALAVAGLVYGTALLAAEAVLARREDEPEGLDGYS